MSKQVQGETIQLMQSSIWGKLENALQHNAARSELMGEVEVTDIHLQYGRVCISITCLHLLRLLNEGSWSLG